VLVQHKVHKISLEGWQITKEGKILLDILVAYKDAQDTGCGIKKLFLVLLPDKPDSQDWIAFGLPDPNEN